MLYLAAMFTAAAFLPFAVIGKGGGFSPWMLVLLALPVGVVLLHHDVLDWLMAKASKATKREIKVEVPQWRDSLVLVARYIPTWLFIGTATYAVTRAITPDVSYPRMMFATILSWVVGFLAVPVPSGAGIRETVLFAAAGVPKPIAITTAVGARIIFVIVDVAGAAICAPFVRRAQGPITADEPPAGEILDDGRADRPLGLDPAHHSPRSCCAATVGLTEPAMTAALDGFDLGSRVGGAEPVAGARRGSRPTARPWPGRRAADRAGPSARRRPWMPVIARPDLGDAGALGGADEERLGGRCPSYLGRRRWMARWRSAAAWLAALASSPSALVTTTRSASSMIPRLMPWRSSPPEGEASSTNTSTRSATASSDWPTPTVSTITTSNPAASHSSERLAGAAGHAAQLGAGGGGADERVRVAGQALHAGLVAEDRAAAAARSTGRRPAPPPGGRCR